LLCGLAVVGFADVCWSMETVERILWRVLAMPVHVDAVGRGSLLKVRNVLRETDVVAGKCL